MKSDRRDVTGEMAAWLAVGISGLTTIVSMLERVFRRGRLEATFVTREDHRRVENDLNNQRLSCLSRSEAVTLFAPRGETTLAINMLERSLGQQIKSVEAQVAAMSTRLDSGIDEVIAALNHPDRRVH